MKLSIEFQILFNLLLLVLHTSMVVVTGLMAELHNKVSSTANKRGNVYKVKISSSFVCHSLLNPNADNAVGATKKVNGFSLIKMMKRKILLNKKQRKGKVNNNASETMSS